MLEGIQFVTNEKGEKTAVLIDLGQYGELWEDFYDVMVSELRQDEPTVPWDELRSELMSGEPASGGL